VEEAHHASADGKINPDIWLILDYYCVYFISNFFNALLYPTQLSQLVDLQELL
jgi:hypothetical protein